MKDILLIANFWHFEEEKASSRYRSMAEVIVKNGYNLEIITSTFRHQIKKQRNIDNLNIKRLSYKITLLYEPEYKKNIGMKRLYSHHIFSKSIKKYLDKRKKPDLIIVSVPSLSVGDVVTKYAKKNNIKVIVDIQDLWPEAFKMVINIPIISDVIFLPMLIQANRIYSRANRIMAVSDTYVNRGLKYNKNDLMGLSLYIGTDPQIVDTLTRSKVVNKPKNQFWIGYVGALGHSYDIKLIIDAIKKVYENGIFDIVFKVMGDGILRKEYEEYAIKRGVKCDFTGFLEYGEMMATLKVCDIAVNPIIGSSVASIINKVSDYAIAGKAVINSQNSKEYSKLLERYECGINCESGNVNDVANAIDFFYNNPDELKKMSQNSLKLGYEKFDREKTYFKVVKLIEECLK